MTETQPQPQQHVEGEGGQPQQVTLFPTLKEVTVFKDRAQLTYTATASLSAGSHLLIMKGEKGWDDVLQNTLQVHTENSTDIPVIMNDVRFETSITRDDVREDVQKLEKICEELQERLNDVADRETVNDSLEASIKELEEKLENMGERSPFPNDDNSNKSVIAPIAQFLSSPSAWQPLVRFIARRKRDIGESRHLLQTESAQLKKELCMKQSALDEFKRNGINGKRHTNVVVSVVVPQPVELRLHVQFVALGASWEPTFDIRVGTNNNNNNNNNDTNISVAYHANVRQYTTMNWNRVAMRLSTATPHCSSSPPKPSLWNITLQPPRPKMMKPLFRAAPMRLMAAPGPLREAVNDEGMVMMADAVDMPAPCAAPVEKAVVSSSTPSSTASTYHIAGLATVKSDNKPVKVTISTHTFPAELMYHVVPKRSPWTYFLAKAKNTSPYVFLPGKSNIFVDNTFVTNSKMELVPAGAEFTASLGTDESVIVTRKEVRRKRSTVRTMLRHPYSLLQVVYEFNVKGSLPAAATLIVKDQSPTPSDNDIKVELINPSKSMLNNGVTEDGIACSMDNVGVVEWKLQLPTGAFTRVFRFAFNVECPAEVTVEGLDNSD